MDRAGTTLRYGSRRISSLCVPRKQSQTGPLPTSIGAVPASGTDVSIRGMDVLTFTDGRISAITVVSDELGTLARMGAVTLT